MVDSWHYTYLHESNENNKLLETPDDLLEGGRHRAVSGDTPMLPLLSFGRLRDSECTGLIDVVDGDKTSVWYVSWHCLRNSDNCTTAFSKATRRRLHCWQTVAGRPSPCLTGTRARSTILADSLSRAPDWLKIAIMFLVEWLFPHKRQQRERSMANPRG